MKKMLTVLALVLALALCVPAMADIASYTIDTYDVELNPKTGTLAVADYDAGCYVLMDAAGNKLTQEKYLYMSSYETGFQIALEEGTNNIGFINGQGALLVPPQYGDIEWLSEDWQIGVVLEEATAEHYDYESWSDDSYYLVASNDVYYKGQLVGSFSRMEYDYAYAYGSYLYVRDREENSAYFDSAMTKSEYTDGSYYSEYHYDYSTGAVWHCGSNQQAFVPGCTLTSADVEQDLYEIDDQVLDLQGNVVFEIGDEWSLLTDFTGDYAVAYNSEDKEGVIDRSGNIVLPCEYDDIQYYDGILVGGYQVVVKDGKVGFVDANGNVTCEFKYGENNFDSLNSPICALQDMEGQYIVLSAAIGELPERYADVRTSYDNGCPIFIAQDANGNVGVIDLYGNVVIPFDGKYDSVYDLSYSADGSVIAGYDGDVYTIYSIGGESAAEAPAAPQTPVVEETPSADEVPSAEEEAPAAEEEAPAAEEGQEQSATESKKDEMRQKGGKNK